MELQEGSLLRSHRQCQGKESHTGVIEARLIRLRKIIIDSLFL